MCTAAASRAEAPEVDDDSTAFNLDPAHTGSTEGTTQAPPLTERWSRDLGDIVSYPLVLNGRVFVTVRGIDGTYGTTLYALDAETGADVWGPTELPGTYYWSGLTAGDSRIYTVGGDGYLTAFDQATGLVDWILDLPGQYSFSSEPTYFDGVVYVGGAGSGSTLYAVDAVDGDLLWSTSIGGSYHSSPAVTEDAVYLGHTCNDVRALDRHTGETLWAYPPSCTGGGGRTAAVADGKVWARQPSGADMILDAASGELVGTFTSDPMPAFHDGVGFFLAGSTLTARDTTTMTKRWNFTGDGQLSSAPMVVNGYVYVGSASGKLFVLDEDTGSLVWTAVTPPIGWPDEHNVSEPVTGLGAGDGLIVVPAGHQLVAFEHLQTRLVPLTPSRILDTRAMSQIGYAGPKPAGSETVTLDVLGHGGVPAQGVDSVVLTLTVTEPAQGGWAVLWPSGEAMPPTSNLNMAEGQTIANQVVVPTGEDGKVAIRASTSSHLIVDVNGYFTQAQTAAAGRFTPLTPTRRLDTRTSGPNGGPAPHAGGSTLTLEVRGHAGVPSAGVAAVAVNIAAVLPTSDGYLTAWPSGPQPLASSLNYATGDVIGAFTIVPVGADGAIRLYSPANTHLVVDVFGWFTDATAPTATAGLFVPLRAARALDTREGPMPAAGSVTTADVDTVELIPLGATSVVANLAATGTDGPGYLTGFAAGTAVPATSNLNYARQGQTISNLALLPISPEGAVSIRTPTATHELLDVMGFFLP